MKNEKKEKKKNWGHHTRSVDKLLCGDHARLANLVIVAIVGFI